MSTPKDTSLHTLPAFARDWRAIAGCCLGSFFAAWSWQHSRSLLSLVLLCAALALLLLAVLFPRLFFPIKRGVDFLLHLLLSFLSYFLLSLLFILCFLPGRFVLLLRKRDVLRVATRGATSNWNELDHDEDPARFKRQF